MRLSPVLLLCATALCLSPALAAAQPCGAANDLLIVLDRSGSMMDPAADGNSKWTDAVSAMTDFVNTYATQLNLGLQPFASDDYCGGGTVTNNVGSSASAIINTMNGLSPASNTPTGDTLANTLTYLQGLANGHNRYAMLVTDGEPNCGAADPYQDAYNRLDALKNAGFKTFVIGFGVGGNSTVLNNMAQHGGEPRAGGPPYYYDVTDKASLAAAMSSIVGQVQTSKPCNNACGNGQQICTNGQWSACSAPAAGATKPCGTSNACGSGTQTCDPATGWSACQAPTAGTTRPCQNKCGAGTETCEPSSGWLGCTAPKNGDLRDCSSACGKGSETCDTSSGWGGCNAPLPTNACGTCGPTPVEVCDGKDNDCNGKIDDGNLCAPDELCQNGACHKRCMEGGCPAGQTCVSGVCEDTGCTGVNCPTGSYCQNASCVDPCSGVTCPLGRVCEGGACIEVSCYTQGCPAGQKCTIGICLPDACASVTCPADEFCRAGQCHKSCAGVSCPGGQVCQDGSCTGAPCGGCPSGQACVGGSCQADPCANKYCGAGRVCQGGSCVDDPCLAVKCPGTQDCYLGQCVSHGTNPGNPDGGGGGNADGGGGGGGADGGGGGGGAQDKPGASSGGCGCGTGAMGLFSLLAAMPLLRRQRRS